jgi:tetratricopeptide (TPR) repeat protein
MGTALAGLGRNDEALEELRKALVLDPNYAKAAAFYRRLAGEEP